MPQAADKLARDLRQTALDPSDVLKRFSKEAKAYVKDHPLAHGRKDEAYSLEMSEEIALCGANATEASVDTKKKKLSPRSYQRAARIIKKRVAEHRRETIVDDDEASMAKLAAALKSRRVNEHEKKSHAKDKDRGFQLEESKNDVNLFSTDIKVVKKPSGKKIMSDLSQIYNRKKKKHTSNVPHSQTVLGNAGHGNVEKHKVPQSQQRKSESNHAAAVTSQSQEMRANSNQPPPATGG